MTVTMRRNDETLLPTLHLIYWGTAYSNSPDQHAEEGYPVRDDSRGDRLCGAADLGLHCEQLSNTVTDPAGRIT